MACCITNAGKHVLHLDLRGGETLHLAPGATSRPLREELLYHNPYLAEWLRQGLARRVEVPFREVLALERAAKAGLSPEEAAEELARVDGIGRATAGKLVEEGIFGLDQLAGCDPERLAGLRGWNEAKAKKALKHAAKLLRQRQEGNEQ